MSTFSQGNGKDKKLLGGKGAGSEMTQIGLPVPPGFVITTKTCLEYFDNGYRLPEGLIDQVQAAMAEVEKPWVWASATLTTLYWFLSAAVHRFRCLV